MKPGRPLGRLPKSAGQGSQFPVGGNNRYVDPDLGDIILARLAELLGPIEVIAIGPPRSPLPVTGHCSRCDSTTTRYGPAGSPLCGRCREGGASRPAQTAGDAESA